MFKFGDASKKRLDTCHRDLQAICNEVIRYIDFSVLEGARSLETQQKYFRDGKTKIDGINKISKHQHFPSMAVDIAPYPIDFRNGSKSKARFYFLAGMMYQASEDLYRKGLISHKLRWGGDWDGDKEFYDQSFDDLPHFELVVV